MKVQRYNPESDFDQVDAWAKSRGVSYDKDLFPPTGWIVDGVAAVFLYETNSKACWIENMCSNPESNSELRGIVLQQLLSAAIREAKDKGYKVAYATTDIQSVVSRAVQHNAVAAPNQTQLKLTF